VERKNEEETRQNEEIDYEDEGLYSINNKYDET